MLITKSAPRSASSRSSVCTKCSSAPRSLAYRSASAVIAPSRSPSMSMKTTSLPARLGVRQRSFTSPSEKVALPAPITPIRTAVPMPPSYIIY